MAIIIKVDHDVSNWNPSINTNGNTDVQDCSPQVYALNGTQKELAGIFYSGAIFAPLQRTDYLPLKSIEPVDDKFHFQINGSKNEELFIHETKLLQVAHHKKDHCWWTMMEKYWFTGSLLNPKRLLPVMTRMSYKTYQLPMKIIILLIIMYPVKIPVISYWILKNRLMLIRVS